MVPELLASRGGPEQALRGKKDGFLARILGHPDITPHLNGAIVKSSRIKLDAGSHQVGFLLLAQVTMAFVVWCVDAMSTDIHNRPFRRLVRAAFWFMAISDYLRVEDHIKIAHASLTVWILLTTGWLLSLGTDRILRPLGLQP